MSSLNLSNSDVGVFNNIYMLRNTGQISVYDLFALKGDITEITGLAPSTLNTLQELAAAMNNDPDFFQHVRDQLDLKRNVLDSYDKSYINNLIALYYTKIQTDTLLNLKLNSSVIDNYYTKTESNNLYTTITAWNNNNTTINSQLNLKANITDLNNYYTIIQTDNIITNYYNRNYIDDKFSQYYTSAAVDNLLDTYTYEKSYIDMNQSIVITNLGTKADKTQLDNYYNQTTTNSLLDNYYNKTSVDNKYYNITGVNSLLLNKADKLSLNDYYEKSYIDSVLPNYYQKYQVDGLLNKYYTFTTSNNLYSTKDDLNNLSITVSSNLTDIVNIKNTQLSFLQTKNDLNNLSITVSSNLTDIANIKNTQLSFLQTNSFNSTIQSYLKVNDFTSASLINITQLNALNLTQTSTISYVNNIYNNVNTNAGSISDISGTLNSVITDVNNVKITLPSFLQTNSFNTTINSFLKINDFTSSSLLNVNAFNTTLNSNLNNYTPLTIYNNTILTRLNTDNNNIIGLQNTAVSNLNNYVLTTTYNNTILTRLNTDSNNIIGLTNTTNSNIGLINNLNNTVGSLITSSTFNSNLNNYLLTSNFNSTISSYLLTNNFNNTINSYLPVNNFNNTINSYLPINNFNNTINSYLTVSSFNTTLNSNLNNYATTTAINSKSNITNPSFFGTIYNYGNITNVSSIYTNNYNTNYSSLRLVNPNIIELSISNPLTTTSNILMSLDNANGADFNCLLSCETNFSVLGSSDLQGNVSCNKILNVSGSSSLNNTTIRGIITGNSSLNISGSTLLRSNLNVSGDSTLNNLTINGTLTGATFTKSTVGLENVANTSPTDLPISTAVQSALNNITTNISNITNPSFFNNVGINTTSSDSALHIVGDRTVNPLTVGIRMGKTNQAFSSSTDSYGIELCSDSSMNGGGTVDFTYPYLSGQSYYAGRMFFENYYGYFGWNANYIPSNNELISNPQMTLSNDGILNVGNLITANNISATSNIYGSNLLVLNNITSNGTLNISGSSVLRSSLSVSGTSNFNNVILNNASTVISSLFISGATTLNSTLNVSGSTLLRGNLNISSTATLNNLTVNGTITGANFNKTLVGLGNVANTSPTDLPISTAIQSALNGKLNNIPNAFLTQEYSTLSIIHNNAIQLGIGNDPLNAQLLMYMEPTSGINLYHNLNFITAKTVFLTGGGLNINGSDTLNLNAYNGVNLWGNNNTVAYFNSVGITLANNTKILQATTGDNNLIIQNTLTGTSSLGLFTNTTVGSRITQNLNGNLNFSVNVSGTSSIPLSLYSNGVLNVNSSNSVSNKILVFNDNSISDTPSTATNFSGIGTQSSGALRYQVPTATTFHRFFCGTTQSFYITNGAGASGSDRRWKTEVEDITNALEKVKQLQGKTFIYNGCTGRQMGMIAQEVKPIVPEVVMMDEDGYHLMCYDRLVALLIESVKELEKRINILENKIS